MLIYFNSSNITAVKYVVKKAIKLQCMKYDQKEINLAINCGRKKPVSFAAGG